MNIEIAYPIPILGFCASGSGAGKTTLLTQLIPLLIQHQLRISVIKHTHHDFDIDHPARIVIACANPALFRPWSVQTSAGH